MREVQQSEPAGADLLQVLRNTPAESAGAASAAAAAAARTGEGARGASIRSRRVARPTPGGAR